MKTWYEVFKSDENGSHTLVICLSLKEARKQKQALSRFHVKLHIDEWQNIENPTKIREIK